MGRDKQLSIKLAHRKTEINTRRINKRKYYGLGVEADRFKDKLQYHFNHTAAIQELEDSIVSVGTGSEDLADDILERTDFLRADREELVEDVEPILQDSFSKGTRRALDSTGERLPAADAAGISVEQVFEQNNYIGKLDADMRRKAEQIIRKGLRNGWSKKRIVDTLRTELKNLVENRSSTISESEVTKAGAAGVAATFQKNDVDRVAWVSSQDGKVCSQGSFRFAYNGNIYTSCRELHGEEFKVSGLGRGFPEPVLSSHPNCRCVLVSVQK